MFTKRVFYARGYGNDIGNVKFRSDEVRGMVVQRSRGSLRLLEYEGLHALQKRHGKSQSRQQVPPPDWEM